MERHERDFKGVWIEREIWLSQQLSLVEKVLFTEIRSLDNERGCYASNHYFAVFFNVSDRQIRTYIASLQEKGFITVTIRNHNERTIRVTGRYARVPALEVRRIREAKAAMVQRFNLNRARG